MRFLFVAGMVALVLSGLSGAALADYKVWQDSETGLSLSVPDTWQQINNIQPDDLVSFMAPSGRAEAYCRVRARDDGRYTIYPMAYGKAIQEIATGYEFWDQYVSEYENVQALEVRQDASFGRGRAGYAVFAYDDAVPGPMMPRRALAFASLYNGTVYIAECSAHEEAFNDWMNLFLSVAGSVDFKKVPQESITGHYRNFMDNYPLDFTVPGENYTTSY